MHDAHVGDAGVRARGLSIALRRVSDPVGFVVVLLVVAWWWYALAIQGAGGDWAFDFRQFWQGAHDIVNGISPYPDPSAVARAGTSLDPDGIRRVFHFPYPAPAGVLLVPLGLLGFHTAAAIWSALLVASLLGSLWILGVRDWRVAAIVVTSAPVISSVRLGSFTPVLVLLVALGWRWRNRPWLTGGSIALAVSLKLFLWPLVVWLLATRRFLAAGISVVFAAGMTLAAWAAIGFDGMNDYPELVRRLTAIVERQGLSLVALGLQVGLPRPAAVGVAWLVGLSLLAGVAVLAHRREDERISFSTALLASLALTPIVWLHYFALLVVPLALTRPRLSWAWGLLWVFWLVPPSWSDHDVWRIVLASALAAIVLVQGVRLDGRRVAT